MPLHVYKRPDTGTLYITGVISPAGSKEKYGVRQRAGSNDRALAEEEAAAIEARILRDHHHGAKPAEWTFAAAATSYVQAEARADQTVKLCMNLVRHFGDRPLSQITQEAIDEARDIVLRPGAAPGTVRRNLIVPVRAIMNHAARRGRCEAPRFELPREARGRTAFLLPEQFEAIHAAAPDRLQPLLRFLVCTGCRLGETLALDWTQVDLSAGRVRLWADQTKGGRERVVELVTGAVVALAGLPGPRTGHVFRSRYRDESGELKPYRQTETGGGGQIATAWAAALDRAGLAGFSPHDLRHTWATWWYALTPDPFRLQRVGGWSSVTLVERYAHLMPAGCEDAIRRVWGTGVGMAVVERRA